MAKETKNLPTAHFDAETFQASNERVITFTNNIYSALDSKDYTTARKLSGQIMHTIQDFYSHSNWIEMGNTNQINLLIGTTQFNNLSFATLADNITCLENCILKTFPCSSIINSNYNLLDLDKQTTITTFLGNVLDQKIEFT